MKLRFGLLVENDSTIRGSDHITFDVHKVKKWVCGEDPKNPTTSSVARPLWSLHQPQCQVVIERRPFMVVCTIIWNSGHQSSELLNVVKEHGKQWKKITAKFFPKRSEHSVRCKHHRMEGNGDQTPKNICGACKNLKLNHICKAVPSVSPSDAVEATTGLTTLGGGPLVSLAGKAVGAPGGPPMAPDGEAVEAPVGPLVPLSGKASAAPGEAVEAFIAKSASGKSDKDAECFGNSDSDCEEKWHKCAKILNQMRTPKLQVSSANEHRPCTVSCSFVVTAVGAKPLAAGKAVDNSDRNEKVDIAASRAVRHEFQ